MILSLRRVFCCEGQLKSAVRSFCIALAVKLATLRKQCSDVFAVSGTDLREGGLGRAM